MTAAGALQLLVERAKRVETPRPAQGCNTEAG